MKTSGTLKWLHSPFNLPKLRTRIYPYFGIIKRTKKSNLLDINTPIIPLKESRRCMVDCLEAVGTPKHHAEDLANVLVEADYRGHYSHGMNRLEFYINDITHNMCDSKATPVILKETAATAWVDGKNGLGAVVGNFCMDLAMKKAKDVGFGLVTAKGSNHYGMGGMYSLQAIKRGLLGMSFSNTSPLMSSPRGKRAALGTNPLALGAPAENGDSFLLDMATTAVALGKLEIERRKNHPIPEGWALGRDGKVTTDAAEGLRTGCLLPLGGTEITSGYKGFGLGMVVEIFCGILSGSKYGPFIRKWTDKTTKADLGQAFLAIDPKCFAPGFESRMSDLMDTIRRMDPVDPSKPVMIPGDFERLHMKAVDKAGGIKYLQNQHDTCEKLCKSLKVKPMQGLS